MLSGQGMDLKVPALAHMVMSGPPAGVIVIESIPPSCSAMATVYSHDNTAPCAVVVSVPAVCHSQPETRQIVPVASVVAVPSRPDGVFALDWNSRVGA